MVNAPQISLKIIVIAHFILSVWASMCTNFLPPAFIYMNAFILAFGIWSLVNAESVDAVLMFVVLNAISILMDIIFLGIYVPYAHTAIEELGISQAMKNEYRFSLAMCIINLLIKPFTTFVLYRLYQDRGGNYSDFGIPGMPGFPGAGTGGRQGNYENIDQSVPSSVESASPHQTIESPMP